MIDFECPLVDFGYDKTFKTLNPDTCSPKSSCFSPPLNSMKDGVPMFNKSAESESEIEYLNTVIRDLRSQINVLQHEAQKRDLNDFECQKQLISCQRVILECKEKEIKSLKITQNSCELRTFYATPVVKQKNSQSNQSQQALRGVRLLYFVCQKSMSLE